ncbi:uncharacterized protein G2W53_004250 [Senna tora]|uniref:Uncharacterized protein n=1 Tax=Senna tora TaxID=362788 RepID=A0A835CK10_9FABA|nr:uncharacterized protein G2W53_004250 [Senna tora]
MFITMNSTIDPYYLPPPFADANEAAITPQPGYNRVASIDPSNLSPLHSLANDLAELKGILIQGFKAMRDAIIEERAKINKQIENLKVQVEERLLLVEKQITKIDEEIKELSLQLLGIYKDQLQAVEGVPIIHKDPYKEKTPRKRVTIDPHPIEIPETRPLHEINFPSFESPCGTEETFSLDSGSTADFFKAVQNAQPLVTSSEEGDFKSHSEFDINSDTLLYSQGIPLIRPSHLFSNQRTMPVEVLVR